MLDKYLESSSNPLFRSPTHVTFLRKIILSYLLIGASAGFFCTHAQAAGPIKGQIDFIGTVSFGDNSNNTNVSLSSATRVALWISSFVSQTSQVAGFNDFSSIAPGTNVTMAAPWIFNPSTNTPSLWNVGGFTFDLATSVVVAQTSTFLNITGVGTVSGNSFDPTPGTWSFTSSSPNGNNNGTFSFQSNTATVPESSTVALLVTGALCLASIQFLRRNHKYPKIEARK
jgi:hypothetical protein